MWFGSNCRPTIPSRGTARSCASGSLRGFAATAAPHVKRSVVWIIAGSSGWLGPGGAEHIQFNGPHWSVGFYDAARFPEGVVSEIDGIPFVLDGGRHSSRLVGAVLDYSNGEYIVHEPPAA
jgi:hypothetical protein